MSTPIDDALRSLFALGATRVSFLPPIRLEPWTTATASVPDPPFLINVAANAPTADECVVDLARKLVARRAGTEGSEPDAAE